MNAWMHECMNAWMNEWMNAWMNEWMHEWMHACMHEWMNEWMNEWVNECVFIHVYRTHHIMSQGDLQCYWVRSDVSLWRRLWLPLSVHIWSHWPTQPMHDYAMCERVSKWQLKEIHYNRDNNLKSESLSWLVNFKFEFFAHYSSWYSVRWLTKSVGYQIMESKYDIQDCWYLHSDQIEVAKAFVLFTILFEKINVSQT